MTMLSEEGLEKISKRALVYALVTVIVVSVIVSGVLYNYSETQSSELDEIKRRLERVEEQVGLTAKYVSVGNITLSFEVYLPVQTMPPNTITYLIGFVTVSNLKNIVVRPITLNVYFEPTVNQTGEGTISYDYTQSQSLDIAPPEMDQVFIPWGAFPVKLENYTKGDIIDWVMLVTAQVEWMGYVVTDAKVSVTYRLVIT